MFPKIRIFYRVILQNNYICFMKQKIQIQKSAYVYISIYYYIHTPYIPTYSWIY